MDAVLAFLWGFLGFMNLLNYLSRYHNPVSLTVAIFIGGVATGAILYGVTTIKVLKIIYKKGGYTASAWSFLYLVGFAVIMVGLFVFAFSSFSWQSLLFINYFLYPMLPAAIVTRILLYLRWEYKNNSIIFCEGLLVGKLIAFPKN
jgi:hypothetical protein